jgi:hypothetical protein
VPNKTDERQLSFTSSEGQRRAKGSSISAKIAHFEQISPRPWVNNQIVLKQRRSQLAFDYVPQADLYLLKFILHDWNDEEAVRILRRCREAMRPNGRVIVIERLLGEIGEPKLAPLADLNMMVLLTGLERTLEQYCLLFRDAGLRFWKCAPIGADMAVIEAVALFS